MITQGYRIGASHVGIGVIWETGYSKYARSQIISSKTSKQALCSPTQDVSGPGNFRRGDFDNLTQLCCVGIDRSKTDDIIDFFEWSEE